MLLIKKGDVYTPESLGQKDLLIEGERVGQVKDRIEPPGDLDCRVLDASGLMVFPGLVDAHVHIAGAGGEGGPETRTPEIRLTTLIEAGITTVIGCLGTDGITRSVESVLMKVKAIRAQGLSAWMYTGAYQVPTPTITGDLGKDIALIEEIIGAGEIALSDHRSSVPTVHELIRLVSQARVGGMLGKKAGIVNIHMGDAKEPFRPIYDAVAMSELPIKQFYPTHCNRNSWIFKASKQYGKEGWVDLTTSSFKHYPDDEIKPSRALRELLEAGVPAAHISMTSDAHGSLPGFDKDGNLTRLEMGMPFSLLHEVRDAVSEGVPLSTALATVTINPSRILKLPFKGSLEAGKEADLILVNKEFEVKSVIAMGEIIMEDGEIRADFHYE